MTAPTNRESELKSLVFHRPIRGWAGKQIHEVWEGEAAWTRQVAAIQVGGGATSPLLIPGQNQGPGPVLVPVPVWEVMVPNGDRALVFTVPIGDAYERQPLRLLTHPDGAKSYERPAVVAELQRRAERENAGGTTQ